MDSEIEKKFQIENLGHSTFLVKVGGFELLTDPFLTKTAGGIKRVTPPAKSPEELSPGFVLISHAHYDHLDTKTLSRLRGEFTVFLPKGCGRFVNRGEIVELKNWEVWKSKDVEVVKVPALHNKGRNLLYPDTEVGGFIVSVGGISIYFAGDTAFSPELYTEIGNRFPSIDFAMLPIGGFSPFPLRKFHQTPEEALKGFLLLKAKFFIPIHFGTWHIIPSFVRRERALERLLSAVYISGQEEALKVIKPGEILTFPG